MNLPTSPLNHAFRNDYPWLQVRLSPSQPHELTCLVNYYKTPAMEGTSPSPSYREQIQSSFERRKAKRPAYSMRAFARDLDYGAPQLSRVMSGKQHLSLANARNIADRLFDSERERELFVAQVELESAATDRGRESAQVKMERLKSREFGDETVILQPEDFQVISDWYHLPILYMVSLRGAPTTASGIAKYLGIGKAEAHEAVERLERLGLIRKRATGEGGWETTHARLHVPTAKVSGAIRKFHRSMIEKALRLVDGVDNEQRYLSGRTITLAPKDLPKFHALIDDFLARASVLCAEGEHESKLYQINVQMFDLAATPAPAPARSASS
jgi:uncharacterized protein (TIGR02147 family)